MSGMLTKMKRRFADGGLTGVSGPQKIDDPKAGRTYNPLAEADYYSYGKGPEHQFFSGNLPTPEIKPSTGNGLPTFPTGGGGGTSGAGALGSLAAILEAQKAGKAMESGWDSLKGLFGKGSSTGSSLGSFPDANFNTGSAPISGGDALGDLENTTAGEMFGTSGSAAAGSGPGSLGGGSLGSITGPSAAKPTGTGGWQDSLKTQSGSLSNGLGMNDAGGILGGAYSLGTKEGKFAGTASGAAAGAQLGGWPGAIVGGVLGYAQEGGWKDANPWSASGFDGIGMNAAWEDQNIARLASNPAASVASKLGLKDDSIGMKLLDPGQWFSKHGDEKRNMSAFTKAIPVKDLGGGKFALPDGHEVNKSQLQQLAGSWYGATYAPDGDQEKWQEQFMKDMGMVYGGKAQGGSIEPHGMPMEEMPNEFRTGGQGFLSHLVKGPGDGRSDEVPARLARGEFVFDAETVALLGNGSTDAGAERLEQLRRGIRSHKGKKLAKGKFSDDAKDPMHYMGAK